VWEYRLAAILGTRCSSLTMVRVRGGGGWGDIGRLLSAGSQARVVDFRVGVVCGVPTRGGGGDADMSDGQRCDVEDMLGGSAG
jgi:hypothetical protein